MHRFLVRRTVLSHGAPTIELALLVCWRGFTWNASHMPQRVVVPSTGSHRSTWACIIVPRSARGSRLFESSGDRLADLQHAKLEKLWLDVVWRANGEGNGEGAFVTRIVLADVHALARVC